MSGPTESFACARCPSSFAKKGSLIIHVNRCHAYAKQFTCARCPNKSFTLPSILRRHIRAVHPPEDELKHSFICSRCSFRTIQKNHLLLHMRLHGPAAPIHKCPNCPASFAFESHLIDHLKMQHAGQGARPFKCDDCPAAFKTRCSLIYHSVKAHASQLHRDNRTKSASGGVMACANCEAAFRNRHELCLHLSLHCKIVQKLFRCGQCAAKFKHKGSLDYHLLSHRKSADLKQFHCTLCPANFRAAVLLRGHMHLHSSENRYRCDHCPRRFKTPGALSAHRIHNHDSDRPQFRCARCLAAFKFGSVLVKHFAAHSNERPYRCAVCLTSYKTAYPLGQHVLLHGISKNDIPRPFKCAKCKATFKKLDHLQRHDAGVHGQGSTYGCAHCLGKFSRRRIVSHLRSHTHRFRS